MQYAGAVFTGIIFGLLCKLFFASQVQNKIRDYQSDIIKSHAKILELEAKNNQLEKRIKEADCIYSMDRLFMN
jgi:hypothetical protein